MIKKYRFFDIAAIIVIVLMLTSTILSCRAKDTEADLEINNEELETSDTGSSIWAQGIEIYMPPQTNQNQPGISIKKVTDSIFDPPQRL